MPRLSATVAVEIPFHDVDAMNVAWHGHYVKYFEIARCELLRKFNYDYPQMQASGYLWPVVECHLKYIKPALYGHQLNVTASLLEHENRLKIGYEITDNQTGERLTKGHTVQLAIEAASMELQFVSPPVVFRNLEAACKSST
ncbi:acyl-CoA thioesterase [Methylobacillus caricis]|uniref:acyl-CoA thioesterase n=1 Tax=Methylobacillus caricis TaxID=1971611 RepID=UPI001CFF9F82|nr:thioesterase family protein [Methylobacillus caricis]MCB5188041.1 acyl-CoA thioesterase [Methylobacillus caricis]